MVDHLSKKEYYNNIIEFVTYDLSILCTFITIFVYQFFQLTQIPT